MKKSKEDDEEFNEDPLFDLENNEDKGEDLEDENLFLDDESEEISAYQDNDEDDDEN